MRNDDDVSISIAFGGNEKDAGDAVKSLADTLKGAPSYRRSRPRLPMAR